MICKGMSNNLDLNSIISHRKIGGGRRRAQRVASCRTVRVTKVGGGESLVGGQTMNRRRVGG